jgi:hypothetical protein
VAVLESNAKSSQSIYASTSGLRFSPSDAQFFSRIFAMALYAYEEGIPATVKTIKNEIQQLAAEKPVLELLQIENKAIS